VKFSVRSKTYSGGASITCHYTVGPPERLVKRVVDNYEAADFDGMIDLKTSKYHEWQGKRTHFGADYIFPSRHLSPSFLAWCSVTVAQKYDVEPLEVIQTGEYASLDTRAGDPLIENVPTPRFGNQEYLSALVYQFANLTDARTFETMDRYTV
jgi:hypothetical protein